MKEKSSKTTFLFTIFSLILILLNNGCSEKNILEDEEQIPIENNELIEKPEETIEVEETLEIPEGMVYVPAGDFIMGSDPDVDPHTDQLDELPQHKVYLDAFFINKNEGSNDDYS